MKSCRSRNLFFSSNVQKHLGEANVIFVRCHICHMLPCTTVQQSLLISMSTHCCGQGLQLAQAACCYTVCQGLLTIWACSPACSTNRMHAMGMLQNAVAP